MGLRYIIIPAIVILYLRWSWKSIKDMMSSRYNKDSTAYWFFLTLILLFVLIGHCVPWIEKNW